MKHDLSEKIRDAGYEALFFLGGFLAQAADPTPRNSDKILRWIDESQGRRGNLKKLAKRGLVSAPDGGAGWVPHLTEQGHAAMAGGRDPEAAWNRPWDGRWRLLTYDLPRSETSLRAKLRRWMCANRFGRIQGSVWVTPDPVPEVTHILSGDRLDPSSVMVFEGGLAGTTGPSDVAVAAWDFDPINAAYHAYLQAASRVIGRLGDKTPSLSGLRTILSKDRKLWWEAVQHDPLLPKAAHPADYAGPKAWKIRRQLHQKLGKTLPSALTD